jgi:hypothetical protein
MQGKTKNKQKVLPSEEIAGSLYMEHRTGVVLRPQASFGVCGHPYSAFTKRDTRPLD